MTTSPLSLPDFSELVVGVDLQAFSTPTEHIIRGRITASEQVYPKCILQHWGGFMDSKGHALCHSGNLQVLSVLRTELRLGFSTSVSLQTT